MAVWQLGGGWTFDTDEFLRVAETPITAIAVIATLPATATVAVGTGVVVVGKEVVKRVVVPAVTKVIVPAGRAIVTKVIVPGAKKLIPKVVNHFSKRGSWYRSAYKWYRRYKILEEFLSIFNGLTLDDLVVVTVHGNPNSDRQTLYYLACAAAFSKVKRYDYFKGFNLGIPPGLFCIEYDHSSRTIEVTLRYITSMNLVKSLINKEAIQQLTLLQGPTRSVTGAEFNFVSSVGTIGGFITNVPKLPYSGKLITTDEILTVAGGSDIATNPKPPGDLRSRGSLYSLVYSALTSTTNNNFKTFQTPTKASTSEADGVVTGG
jgi:hypothetical protein